MKRTECILEEITDKLLYFLALLDTFPSPTFSEIIFLNVANPGKPLYEGSYCFIASIDQTKKKIVKKVQLVKRNKANPEEP